MFLGPDDVDHHQDDYLGLLKSRGIDIVIDLSVNETRAMLVASDRAGVTGSCLQVAAGLHAAFRTVVEDPLEKRVYFVEDLLGTTCERLMMANLPMQHVVVSKKQTAVG